VRIGEQTDGGADSSGYFHIVADPTHPWYGRLVVYIYRHDRQFHYFERLNHFGQLMHRWDSQQWANLFHGGKKAHGCFPGPVTLASLLARTRTTTQQESEGRVWKEGGISIYPRRSPVVQPFTTRLHKHNTFSLLLSPPLFSLPPSSALPLSQGVMFTLHSHSSLHQGSAL